MRLPTHHWMKLAKSTSFFTLFSPFNQMSNVVLTFLFFPLFFSSPGGGGGGKGNSQISKAQLDKQLDAYMNKGTA